MSETPEFLRDYRARMDCACDDLGMKLVTLGAGDRAIDDHEIVELAGRKLETLFNMLNAAGLSIGILHAVMAE